MKKFTSVAIALMMILSVSAMPAVGARKAAQQDYAVDGCVAWYAGTVEEDQYHEFQLVLSNGDNNIAALSIYALAQNKLAGLYAVAPTNGSYLMNNKTAVYGFLAIECINPQGSTLGTYNIEANLFDNAGNAYYLVGTCENFIAVDYHKYQQDPSTSGIVLVDTKGCPGELVGVYTAGTEGLDLETYASAGYWGYFGNDDNNYVECYMPFDVVDKQYTIVGGAYYVEAGGIYDIDWNANQPVNGKGVVRGVMEVQFISEEDANFSAFLQCTNGNVYYVYDFTETALEEVEAAEVDGTAKIIRNGQFMIIRNGVRYNALGAVVK